MGGVRARTTIFVVAFGPHRLTQATPWGLGPGALAFLDVADVNRGVCVIPEGIME